MKKSHLYFLLICLMAGTFKGFSQEMILTNVHVITMENDQVLSNQGIHILDGKILDLFPMHEIGSKSSEIKVFDGGGAYVFPGLAEFHAHLPVAADGSTQLQEESMWLYLANGVLRIRSMLGHPSHLDLRQRVNSGQTLGPKVFISGPSFNANSVTSPDQANQMVKEQKNAGYDHLKIHPGVELDEMWAISKAAKEQGIPFGGHVPLAVGLQNSLESGFKSVEHMDGFLEAMLPDGFEIDPTSSGPFNLKLVHLVDSTKLPSLIQLTLQKGVWMAPTLTLFDRYFGYIPADQFRKAPEMKYLPGILIQQWVNTKKQLEATGVLSKENVAPYLKFRNALFLQLHQAGVPMIMSSDSPQVFNVPGFSIHHEIKMMSEAGMSNYEILKTGSVNAAQYMEMQDEWGMIKTGFAADLVLVQKNPLIDLSTMQNPLAIMIQGKMIERSRLNEELNRIEQNHLRK